MAGPALATACLLALAVLSALLVWLTYAQALQPPAAARANLAGLGLSLTAYAAYLAGLRLAFVLVHLVLAAVILRHKSGEAMALFTALMLALFGALYWSFGLPRPPAAWAGLLGGLRLAGSVGLALFFCLFPTGRFVPRWSAAVFALFAAIAVGQTFFPGAWVDIARWPRPLGVPVAASLLLLLLAAQVVRYRRRSDAAMRQQTRWVVFGAAAALVIFILIAVPRGLGQAPVEPGNLAELATGTGSSLAFLLIPLSIGVAVLRFRLWDLDLLINRTLVYAALSASLVGLYSLVVAALGAVLPARGLVSILAAGLIAVLFEPLRERLQRGVNRLLYGERDDPYQVISRLGQRLEASLASSAVLATITETIREALRLPYVAIALDRDEPGEAGGSVEVAAASGRPAAGPVTLPLLYQGEAVGQLLLGPRVPGESFNPSETRLLADLARQAGVAVHAVRLTADLQRSRERLVAAREEERRRLRRDLHDGLGPRLAGQAFKLEAARDAVLSQPERAVALLDDMIGKTQSMIAELRQLVYGLRPPALDELGLEGAVREVALQGSGNGTQVSVSAPPGGLPPLPAAVEVAAYRIVQEALNNVLRHANATQCAIRLAPASDGAALVVEVQDDGTGVIAGARTGVGAHSMRERAEELGGQCWREAGPGGATGSWPACRCRPSAKRRLNVALSAHARPWPCLLCGARSASTVADIAKLAKHAVSSTPLGGSTPPSGGLMSR